MKFALFVILLKVSIFLASCQIRRAEPEKILKGHEYTILCLDVDKTSSYVVSGSYDTNVILWDYKSGKQLEKFNGHNSGVWSVKISPNSKYVATGSWDNNQNAKGSAQNCLNILDIKTLKVIKSLSISPDRYKTVRFIPELDDTSPNGIYDILFNADGSKIAAITRSGDLFIWDINDYFNETAYNFRETKHDLLALSPDWKYIACTERKRSMVDTGFYLLQLGTNEIIANFNNPKRSVIEVYFSSNSQYIASISGDRIMRNEIDIWDSQTQKLLFTLKGHSNVIRSIAFGKNDKYLASAGEDNLVNLWNIQSGKLIVSFTENNEKELTSVVFSPNQQYLITGSQDKTIKYWNIEEWINEK
jgi:WD40 repeat protein